MEKSAVETSEKLLEYILNVFSRFIIIGVIFYFNIIFLTSCMFNLLNGNNIELTNGNSLLSPYLIFPIIIFGVLLEASRAHTVLRKIFFKQGKKDLREKIISSFNIICDENEKQNVSSLIHEVIIKSISPLTYVKIEKERNYPNILSMTILSLIVFLFFEILLLLKHIINETILEWENYAILGILNFFIIFCIIRGVKKIRIKYDLLNDYTFLEFKKLADSIKKEDLISLFSLFYDVQDSGTITLSNKVK